MARIEGGCHCGAIRYTLSAPPEASMRFKSRATTTDIVKRTGGAHDQCMRMIVAVAALVLAACSPPSVGETEHPSMETTATTAPGQLEEFMLPSGNIGCAYIPAGGTAVYRSPDGRAELQCDRVAPAYVRIVLSETGPGVVQENLGEAPCCSGEVVAHGQTWSRGPFTCESAEAGLTCTNASGNRLVLSRERAETN